MNVLLLDKFWGGAFVDIPVNPQNIGISVQSKAPLYQIQDKEVKELKRKLVHKPQNTEQQPSQKKKAGRTNFHDESISLARLAELKKENPNKYGSWGPKDLRRHNNNLAQARRRTMLRQNNPIQKKKKD
jgi:hypothetical protein